MYGAARANLTAYLVGWWLSVYLATHSLHQLPEFTLEAALNVPHCIVTRLVPFACFCCYSWGIAERLSLGRSVDYSTAMGEAFCSSSSDHHAVQAISFISFSASIILSLSLLLIFVGAAWVGFFSWLHDLPSFDLLWLLSSFQLPSTSCCGCLTPRGCRSPFPAKIYCSQVCRLCLFL